MSFTKTTSVLPVVTLILCCLTVTGEQYVHHACIFHERYNVHDLFQKNLHEFLGYLSYQTPQTGFGLGYKGEGQDRVYELALCRPDVPPSKCSTCLAEAIKHLDKGCQNYKGGVIWSNRCQLQYSNRYFFSQTNNQTWFFRTGNEIVDDPAPLNKKSVNLLSKLAEQASKNTEMFATGNVKLGGSEKLYGWLSAPGTFQKQLARIVL